MQTTQSFDEIRQSFAEQYKQDSDKRQQINAEMEIHTAQLQSLERSIIALNEKRPRWIEQLLTPVVKLIEMNLPEWECEDDRLSPMGVTSRVPVFLVRKDRKPENANATDESLYIVFRPGNLNEGQLLYETGATVKAYKPGTLGALNGMNMVTKPLENIEEALAFLKKQIAELEQTPAPGSKTTLEDGIEPQQPEGNN